ncbi:lytic polysaccharide monooxygenase [Bacillus bombysepticus]|uniref:Chitin-binding protein n=1 Tax=Bacillus thuringiensis serovar kumamotoensis TaxID=132267 RepID=A0A9X6PRY4_BACUK|nr:MULTISPECIES: lytic polysaccharide monooxygenase [Bacillus cereus group]MEC2867315.1 lytic polysaccharide monooxygenase [Bacillus cereus]OTZ75881.1 chitin-binding protein [Bacillus thuringiensis serovar kumamtoensis]
MHSKLSFNFTKKIISKKTLGTTILASGILGTMIIPQNAYAHGFVEKPGSRAALCSQTYGALNLNCGEIMYEPQSLEAPKGFPQNGPVDGKIASAGGKFGGILDQQTADRWFKNTITGGENTFTWHYTAAHLTSQWHYYITKKGWNPNKPLTRADFEPIGTVKHDGSAASNNLSHKIHVPTDRNGYHVILAVWDVADTANAFYNVIDVNLINGDKPDTEAPTQPQALHTTKVTANSVELNWNPSTDNVGVKEYQVVRDGKVINTVPSATFTDKNLKANTGYTYTVKALDASGNVSKESNTVFVKTTNEVPDTEAPTQPKGLHSMGTTSSSIDLMWSPSDDNFAVDHYAVYRETSSGQFVVVGTSQSTSFTDKSVQPNTTYKYTVTAVDKAGNESIKSNILTATTKEQGSSYEQWNPYKAYKKGDKVVYQGKIYEAVQNYQGHGDPNWISALSLWKTI